MDSPWEDTSGRSGVLSCPPACLCGLAYKHKVAPEICQVGDDTGLASQEDTDQAASRGSYNLVPGREQCQGLPLGLWSRRGWELGAAGNHLASIWSVNSPTSDFPCQ